MTKTKETLLGVKVPEKLKEQVFSYCDSQGIKIKYFVTVAIKEKLIEALEDAWDIGVAKKRLKDPTLITKEQFKEYIYGKK